MHRIKARQSSETGLWAMTELVGGIATPIGFCRPFEDWNDAKIDSAFVGGRERYDELFGPHHAAHKSGKFHDGGHATAAEALECFRQYLLEIVLRFRPLEMRPFTSCYVGITCREPDIVAEIPGWGFYAVCNKHANRESMEQVLHIDPRVHT